VLLSEHRTLRDLESFAPVRSSSVNDADTTRSLILTGGQSLPQPDYPLAG
jgi:hypothetical protein